MRAIPILLALLAASVSFAALVPAAEAKPYCTYGEKGCEWDLVCLWRPTEVCAGDPCWFMCEPMADAAAAATCVPLTQGHVYTALCVDARQAPDCAVYVVRAYAGEVFVSCIGVEPAALALAGPECYDTHREFRFGPVTILQRSSCDYEVHVDEDPVLLA